MKIPIFVLCVLFISPSLAKDKAKDVVKDKREAPVSYPGTNSHHQISISPSVEVASGSYHQSSAPQISYAPARSYGAPSAGGHQDIYTGGHDSSLSIGGGAGSHDISVSNSYPSAIEGNHGSVQGYEDIYSHSDSSSYNHGIHGLSAILVDGSASQGGQSGHIQTVSYQQSHPSNGHGFSSSGFGGSSHGGQGATIQITPIASHNPAPSVSYGVPQSGHGSGAQLSPSISYGLPSAGASSAHGFSAGGHGFSAGGHGTVGKTISFGSSKGFSGGQSIGHGSFSSGKGQQRPVSVTYGVPSSHSTPSGSYGVPNPVGSQMSFGGSKGLFGGSFGGAGASVGYSGGHSGSFGGHGGFGNQGGFGGFKSNSGFGGQAGFGHGASSNFGGFNKISSGPSFSGGFSHGGASPFGGFGGFPGGPQSFGHGFGMPSGSYGPPMSFAPPFMSFGHPMSFGPSASYGPPAMTYGPPSFSHGSPISSNVGSFGGHSVGSFGGQSAGSFGGHSAGSFGGQSAGSFGGHGFSSSNSHNAVESTPSYAAGTKGLGHYSSGSSGIHSQSVSVPHISKPVAISTQPSYHHSASSSASKAPFRPSTFLGAHIESSGPEHSQYSSGSSQQYSLPSQEYGTPFQGGFAGKSYDDHSSYEQPSESYGTPAYNTIQYSSPSGH